MRLVAREPQVRHGAWLGYTEIDDEKPGAPAERENPQFVIKPVTFPSGFTLYRNDFKLGNYLFLNDIGQHDTINEAKVSAASTIAMPAAPATSA